MYMVDFFKVNLILPMVFLLGFYNLQAQQNESNSEIGFAAEFSASKMQSLSNNATSIFQDETLRSDYSVGCDLFIGLHVMGRGHLGIRISDVSFCTSSPYNETVDISSFMLSTRLSKSLPSNLEIFTEASIGASVVRNFYTLADAKGTANRNAFCCDVSVGIGYGFSKYFIGVKGGFFGADFGKTKEKLNVPTSTGYFSTINSNIGLCFGIRL